MTSDSRPPTDSDETLVERVLAAAGERPVLPDHLRERWTAQFTANLAEARRTRRRRATARWLPLAACLAIGLALVGQFLPGESTVPDRVARIVVSHGISEVGGETAETGSIVTAGATVRTGSTGYLALDIAGVDVRVAPDSVLLVSLGEVQLDRGQIYVDTGAGPTSAHLDVVTNLGRIRHQGTQFLVDTRSDELMFAVREGRVELVTEWSRFDYTADPKNAPFVTVWRSGTLELRNVPRHGGVWSWAEHAAPGLQLAGHSIHEALSWAAREQGYRLSYASPAARQRADETLHASSDPHLWEAQELLQKVPRITNLDVDYFGGEVSVSERDDDAD